MFHIQTSELWFTMDSTEKTKKDKLAISRSVALKLYIITRGMIKNVNP